MRLRADHEGHMINFRNRDARLDSWTLPLTDPSQRLRTYGRIRPMDEKPGFFRRLLQR